jgi:acyl-coenzyme A synthetase/AMP-(fatty) acid ligase
VGEVGELCVRGATVTHGYWGDGERSARSFLSVSSAGPDVGLYRTGDLARRDADGNHWFLGRVDDQVKCRGYRIALGDVEAAVLEHPLVSECIVVPVPDDLVGSRLFAFVVTSRAVTGAELARFCGDRVPRYMVPERFELRAALPRTPSGKFDRRALLEEGKECWLVAH